MKHTLRRAIGGVSLAGALAAAALGGAGTAGAENNRPDNPNRTTHLTANLRALNNSGASGSATAKVKGTTIRTITVRTQGLFAGPHAQHIHYGDDARNECPTLARDDKDRNGLITTPEGQPAYGPIVVSLTTRGGTTPASALAVPRYPASSSYSYSRSGISFTDVRGTGYTGGNGTAEQIAESIREGEGVVVVHGVDLNGNGRYDGPASPLTDDLPLEATIPALCGRLGVKNHH